MIWNPIVQFFLWFTLLAVVLYTTNVFNLFLLPRLIFLCYYVYGYWPVRCAVKRASRWITDRAWEIRYGRRCFYCGADTRDNGGWFGEKRRPVCEEDLKSLTIQ